MERWYRINVGLSMCGVLLCAVSMMFFKKMPLFLLPAMFGLGMAFKGFKNIYKNEGPERSKKSKRPNYNGKRKK
ncbi:MAG: hypothetical protein ACRC3Y_12330 [Romboutsia sp.]|uniref:hypothetical protein n=1 Tax=Romboutsia sp. TaxID=1965302 RepID=UPI003F2AD0F1